MSLHLDNAIGTDCCDDIDRAFLRIAMFLLKVCMIALFVELAMGLGAKAQTPQQAFEEVGPLEGLTGSQIYNRLAGPEGLGWNVAPAGNGIGQVFTKDLGNGTTVAIRVDPAHGGPGTGQPIDRNFAGDVPHVHKESVPTERIGVGTNPGNYLPNAAGKQIYDVATNGVIPQPVAPVDQPLAHAPTSRELPAVQPNEVTVVDPSTGLSQPRPELVYPNAQYGGNPFWPPVPAEEAASCAASMRGRNLGRVAGALFALVAGVQGAREEIEAARQEGRDPSKVMAVLRGWYDFSVAPFVAANQVGTETFNHQIDSMQAAVARGEDPSEWAEAITASAKTLYKVSGAQSAVEGCGEAIEMGKSFLEEYRANRQMEQQQAAQRPPAAQIAVLNPSVGGKWIYRDYDPKTQKDKPGGYMTTWDVSEDGKARSAEGATGNIVSYTDNEIKLQSTTGPYKFTITWDPRTAIGQILFSDAPRDSPKTKEPGPYDISMRRN